MEKKFPAMLPANGIMEDILQTIAPFSSHCALKQAEDEGSCDRARVSAAPCWTGLPGAHKTEPGLMKVPESLGDSWL